MTYVRKVVMTQWTVTALLIVAATLVYWYPRAHQNGGVINGIRVPMSLRGPRMTLVAGNGGPDTLFLFTDFRCPYCRSLERRLDRGDRGKQPLVVRFFPTHDPPKGALAALMAYCADRVGRFGAMYRALFAANEVPTVGDAARMASVPDSSGFRRCVYDPQTQALLGSDVDSAVEIGVHGTPTAVYRNRMFVGVAPIARLLDGR